MRSSVLRYSQAFIDRVISHTNIVEIISKHTTLQLSSGRLFALCPYPDHEEKTPSFSVSEEKQVYYCFGCQKSGNVITFLRDIRGLNFREAIHYLSVRAGISIQKGDIQKVSKVSSGIEDPLSMNSFLNLRLLTSSFQRKKVLYRAQEIAMNFWHQKLLGQKQNKVLKEYFKKRNLSLETIKQFKIGWAPPEGFELIQILENEGIPLDLVFQTGLIRKSKDTGVYYNGFRNRLIFPIFSTQFQCVGFGGRALEKDVLPKYLNSSESEIFHKAEILYGLDQSALHIRNQDKVFVVEGYMDFISLFQRGVKNVVSTLGTSFSFSQAKRLRFLTKNIILFFDGDSAGKNASLRSLLNLLSSGAHPRMFGLPEGMDPDEWIRKKGISALEVEIKRTPELFEVFLEEKLKNFTHKASEKIQILDQITPILQSISDSRLKNLYVDEVSKRLDLKKEVINKNLRVYDLKLHARNKPKNRFSDIQFLNREQGGELKTFNKQNKGLIETEINKKEKSKQNHEENLDDRERKSILEIKLPVPKAEHFLLHLALKNKKVFLKLIEEKKHVISCFTHEGVKKIFHLAEKIYGQNSNVFDRMIALLMIKVKPAQVLTPPLFIERMELESVNQLVSDCCFQIQDLHLQKKCDVLSKKIELTHSPEETNHLLKKFMNERLKRQKLHKMRFQIIEP